jgi:hypothetical protein
MQFIIIQPIQIVHRFLSGHAPVGYLPELADTGGPRPSTWLTSLMAAAEASTRHGRSGQAQGNY